MIKKSEIRDFVFEWREHEESFIFWMLVLNITAKFDIHGFLRQDIYDLFLAFRKFSVDIALSFVLVCVIDFILYCSLRKFHFFHTTVKFILVAVNLVMFCIDIFTIFYFQLPLNNILFEFTMMTNFREGTEFLQTYFANPKFWIVAFTMIIAVFMLRFFVVSFFRNRKNLKIFIFVFGCVLGISALFRQLYMLYNFRDSHRGQRIINSVGLPRIINLFYTYNANSEDYETVVNQLPEKVLLTKNESTIPYIVYILGESTNRNHMGLYGYRLQTNPLLSERFKKGGGTFLVTL